MAGHQPVDFDLTGPDSSEAGENIPPPAPMHFMLGPGPGLQRRRAKLQHLLHLGPLAVAPDTEARLQQLCQHHGVLIPDAARHTHPDQASQFQHRRPICCHYVVTG